MFVLNALVILIAVYLIDALLRATKRERSIICVTLSLILISNVYCSKQGIAILDSQLAPLKNLLSNIRIGINNGQINTGSTLYLNSNIAKRLLPPLCWNREMGELFMQETYQWLFLPEEIGCFSSSDNAKWVIDAGDLSIISKSEVAMNQQEQFIKLDANSSAAYTHLKPLYTFSNIRDFDLSHIYMNLGSRFYINSEYDKAIEYYQRAIKLNPGSAELFHSLGSI
jgi:tetratricopeptide (TPR) repeat protein